MQGRARVADSTHTEARLNPMYHCSPLILLPDECALPVKRQRKRMQASMQLIYRPV